jgi:hypothetical protein
MRPHRSTPRGGNWFTGANDGVFAVLAGNGPSFSFGSVGFRCAR